MRDLLLEIGTEEMPGYFILPALRQLRERITGLFDSKKIKYGEVKEFATPRRMALLVKDVEEREPDEEREIAGPPEAVAYRDGKPTKALKAFLKRTGVSEKDVYIKEMKKGRYVAVKILKKGAPTAEILARKVPEIILSLRFPKTMRWGHVKARFGRPIRWVVALFGDETVNFEVAGVASSNLTRGLRIFVRSPIPVRIPQEYEETLEREGKVIVDVERRREIIRRQAEELAGSVGGMPDLDEDLLEEITFLVELPKGLLGGFEERYLDLPPEVLRTLMKHHQRFVPVVSKDGGVLPYFIVFKNGLGDDRIVLEGNERVLRARLEDAKYFFKEDTKVPLEERIGELKGIMFVEGLGTLYDKVKRLEREAEVIGRRVGLSEGSLAKLKRSALLSKADRATEMVSELPELEGTMGKIYLILSGEDKDVAAAVEEHYFPRSADGPLPSSDLGFALGIADRIDTLVGLWSIGYRPKGSYDPLGARKNAVCLLRLLHAKRDWNLPLRFLVDVASSAYKLKEDVYRDIKAFLDDRLRGLLLERGIRYDVADAVIAWNIDHYGHKTERAFEVTRFIGTDAFTKVYTAAQRVIRLAGAGEPAEKVDPTLFTKDEEREFFNKFTELSDKVRWDMEFKEALGLLEGAVGIVFRFFDNVMVMCEDARLRANRLALLNLAKEVFDRVVDFSKIVEERVGEVKRG